MKENEIDIDPTKNFDPVGLFIRADERVQQVEAEQHDVSIQFRDHKNEVSEKFREQNAMIQELLKRMDGQVSFTGRKNSDDIKALETKMAKIDTQLFDPQTGLITQFSATRDWQGNFNKTVIGCFITVIAALIIYLIQHPK